MKRCLPLLTALLLPPLFEAAAAPLIDYHQHLLSPRAAKLAGLPEPLDAAKLISLLDNAGIKLALVLSLAYSSETRTGLQ